MTEDQITRLTSRLSATFTFGDLVRAAERDPHEPVSAVLEWFRHPRGVRDTGRRRGSAGALSGAKLYSRV
jgi:hypothetical protein